MFLAYLKTRINLLSVISRTNFFMSHDIFIPLTLKYSTVVPVKHFTYLFCLCREISLFYFTFEEFHLAFTMIREPHHDDQC